MKQKKLMIIPMCVFLSSFFLISCEVKEMHQLNIHIVGNKRFAITPESNMPEKILCFIKPIECEKNVYVPKVTIHRTDLLNDSSFLIIVPKTAENQLKDKFGFYDYNSLKDDYETFLPNLQVGVYLSKEDQPNSTKKSFNYSASDLTFILTDKINSNSNKSFKSSEKIVLSIKDLICNGKFDIRNKIIILLDDNYDNSPKDSISAETALGQFHNWVNKNVKSPGIRDSALQKLEKKYPKDYRFTLERLKIKTESGELKQSDEYLLLLVVEKAINEGKAPELLAIINKMNLPKETKEKAQEGIIKKPVVIVNTLTPDKAISFRKQKIDAKLINLADASYTQKERKLFKDITLEDFENGDVKVIVESSDSSGMTAVKSIDDYLNQLRFSKDYKIKVVSVENGSTGKISAIKVIETY